MKKLPADFSFLPDMYADSYFPEFLVDKLKNLLIELADLLATGITGTEAIQEKLDETVEKINQLQEEFEENDSEIETVARDTIGVTIEKILKFYGIDIEIEEAIRARDW
jgi:hypothetical protein